MLRSKNLINYLIAFLIILSLNFFLPRLMPGDPLMAIYGEEALIQMSPELEAQLIEKFALEDSFAEQFGVYLNSLAKGDLGYSYYYNAPVLEVILGALPWTFLLVGTAILISTILGFILGVESGWRQGKKTDKALLTGVMFLSGLPDFFIGILLLLIFGVMLELLPLGGAMSPYANLTGLALIGDALKHLVLPLTALTMVNLTGAYLLTRNTMITTLKQPYIFTAKAKGLPDRLIRYKHAGKNSALPIITRTGLLLGRVLTGSLFIEIVFAYPGLGLLIQGALETRDYPLLQGILLLVAIIVLTVNLIIDILYKIIDPRVNHAH